MKKLYTAILASLLIFALTGCAKSPGGDVSKQSVGTVASGVAGVTPKTTVYYGDNKAFGAVGGSIVGGLLGSSVGESMDDQDRVNMQQAMITTPVGQEASWSNAKSGTKYFVRPIRSYNAGSYPCRRVRITSYRHGRTDNKISTICRSTSGRWYIADY